MLLGNTFKRSIARQRQRRIPTSDQSRTSLASPTCLTYLNHRPYSAKYAPPERVSTAFASEVYHEREIPGKPYQLDRYLKAPTPATTETPMDLTPEQRKVIERTLRVDLVGEGAANWIYQSTKFVTDLKGDKETSKKVEVCIRHARRIAPLFYANIAIPDTPSGNVVDGAASSTNAFNATETTSRETYTALPRLESRGMDVRSWYGDDGSTRDHGLYRGD
jgi:hypothetical protein